MCVSVHVCVCEREREHVDMSMSVSVKTNKITLLHTFLTLHFNSLTLEWLMLADMSPR